MVKAVLYALAAAMVVVGLWDHDWRMIVAAAAVAAIWPLIDVDIQAVAAAELLDELWDDEAAA